MSFWVRYAGFKDVIISKAGACELYSPVNVGPGFPPFGTLINTLYLYEYPVAQGGQVVNYDSINLSLIHI